MRCISCDGIMRDSDVITTKKTLGDGTKIPEDMCFACRGKVNDHYSFTSDHEYVHGLLEIPFVVTSNDLE